LTAIEAEAAAKSRKGSATMSVLDLLKKGFGYFLLSMGVSRPIPKPKPAQKPAAKNEPGR
jgi:hypothetical protein